MQHFVIWLLPIVCFVQCAGGENVTLAKELKMSFKRIGFIHVTKTGGTAIEKSIYAKYLKSFGHKITLDNYTNQGEVVVCVLRHPRARLVSIFNYWRYGSDLYHRESYWNPPVDSVEDFVTAWRDNTHIKHAEVIRTISEGRGFTWAAHFYPQAYWLPDLPLNSSKHISPSASTSHTMSSKSKGWWGHVFTFATKKTRSSASKISSSRQNVIIVRHSSSRSRFSARVTAAFTLALNLVNISKTAMDIEKEKGNRAISLINVSRNKQFKKFLLGNKTESKSESVSMSTASTRWMEDHFRKDFELYSSAQVQFQTGRGQWRAVF